MVVTFQLGQAILSLVPAPGIPATGPVAYWGVEDIEAALARLVELGARPRGEIITSATRSRTVTLTDPFGNVLGLACKPADASKKSLAGQPSETAIGTTLFRALACYDERLAEGRKDRFAELFLPAEFRRMLPDAAGRDFIRRRSPGSYEFFVCRTGYFDDAFRQALDEGLPQIVLLGAGYDTRACRFRDLIRSTRIFEVDIASTQQRKQRILAEARIAVPESVSCVTVDFTRDLLEDALPAAGFDKSQPSLWIWEGVMYYLPEDAVDATLQAVRALSAPGGSLRFDCLLDAPDMLERHGVAACRALMKDTYHVERILSRVAEGGVAEFLAARGFALREELPPVAMRERYLPPGSEEVLACFSLVRAEPVCSA
jgi:methyltransferase (TIGR00027 family)